MDPKGKVGLVTGAAQGLGLAIATELLKEGCKGVALCDLDPVKGEEEVQKLQKQYGKDKAIFIKVDVTKEEQLEGAFKKTIEQYGYIDIVMNNAGLFNDRTWEYTMQVNLMAVIRGNLLALKYMSKEEGGKGGVVVNMGSTAGVGGGILCTPIYVAAKHGVVGLTRSFRSEYLVKNTGLRVMCICPSTTTSNIFNAYEKAPEKILLRDNWLGEFDRELATMPAAQPAERVGQGVVHMIRHGKSGSIWMSQSNELFEINIPDYESIRV